MNQRMLHLALAFALGLAMAPPALADARMSVAASHGDTAGVKALIDAGVDLNQPDEHGYTPLHWAAQQGHLGVAGLLVVHGARLDERDRRGLTPLMIAASQGHASLVAALVEWGADPLQRSPEGHAAAAFGPPGSSVVKAIEIGTQLGHAAAVGELGLVQRLVQSGADPNRRGRHGKTPLYLAAQAGHAQAVRALIDGGANVNMPNQDRFTPLVAAVQGAHAQIARMLLDEGASTVIATDLANVKTLDVGALAKRSQDAALRRVFASAEPRVVARTTSNLLIVPGRSVGDIAIGAPIPPQVFKDLGSPNISFPAEGGPGSGLHSWGGRLFSGVTGFLSVSLGRPGDAWGVHAIEISDVEQELSLWPTFRTEEGIAVGSPFTRVQERFPDGQKHEPAMDADFIWEVKSAGISFAVYEGTVSGISVFAAE